MCNCNENIEGSRAEATCKPNKNIGLIKSKKI